MAWTQADVDALSTSIKQGAKVVDYDGVGSVTYHSLDEMLRLRDRMVREVAMTGNGVAPPMARLGVFSR